VSPIQHFPITNDYCDIKSENVLKIIFFCEKKKKIREWKTNLVTKPITYTDRIYKVWDCDFVDKKFNFKSNRIKLIVWNCVIKNL
jgi:hypothetical protein